MMPNLAEFAIVLEHLTAKWFWESWIVNESTEIVPWLDLMGLCFPCCAHFLHSIKYPKIRLIFLGLIVNQHPSQLGIERGGANGTDIAIGIGHEMANDALDPNSSFKSSSARLRRVVNFH